MLEVLGTRRAEVAWGTDRLRAAGMPNPRGEATAIWTALAGESGGEVARFRDAVTRRASGEPMAYACGTVGFRRLILRSDARALIPRPESEGLIDLALQLAPRGRALDLGTGSGCLALALAEEGDYDVVVGVDLSPDAIALAEENGRLAGRQVDWRAGSWCAPVEGMAFDLVVSNPPYLTRGEIRELDPSVGAWEPVLALDGGDDGLAATAVMLEGAANVLAPGGTLIVELDARRARMTRSLLPSRIWEQVTITDDLFGRNRYLSARKRGAHS